MHREIDRLQNETFDIIVIGGGMHGAWVALRATLAGYRVALLERHDFGAATSANSLKILHGGLRYLQHLDFGRMRSSIRARREFSSRYPEYVRPLPCVMPLQATGVRSPWILGPALLANDLLSADRNAGVNEGVRLPMGRLISGRKCAQYLRPLATRQPLAGAMWWDAIAVDATRLVLMPVLAAAEHGAAVANRVDVTEYVHDGRAVRGVTAVDRVSGKSFEIKSRMVVNAAGPWAGELAKASNLTEGYMPPAWVGCLNLVLRKSMGLEVAVALSAESKPADGSAVLSRATRELFFVPWRNLTLVGTDYVPIAGLSDMTARPSQELVAKFVHEIAHVAPNANVSLADVASVHWGLLPVARAGDELPTKIPVLASGSRSVGVTGLVVVIGEKLTSAPELSKRVMEQLMSGLGSAPSKTKQVRRAALLQDGSSASVAGMSHSVMKYLAGRYGADWARVAGCASENPSLLDPVHADSQILGVEIVHAIRHEMALNLEDIVMRRLGLRDSGSPGVAVLLRCAEVAAGELGWDDVATLRAVATVTDCLNGADFK